MALPTILFNNGTGSDTAASGAGPGTAVTGTGASLNATTTVTVSADSPDLSGIATDGSAVLWVKTSSGQQFAKITGTDNGAKTITVATAYSVTESGKTWAVGGKRKTLDNADSRVLLTTATGALPGWTLTFEDDSSASLSSAILAIAAGDTTTGWITIQGSAEGRVMNQTASANHFTSNDFDQPNYLVFKNLKFTNSNATKTNAIVANAKSGKWMFRACIFGDATNTLRRAVSLAAGSSNFAFFDCEVTACTDVGINNSGSGITIIDGCWIHGCASDGVGISNSIRSTIVRSLITGNGGDGVKVAGGPVYFSMSQCTIHGNTGDGLDLSGGLVPVFVCYSNNFTGNGNYGIRAASNQPSDVCDYNNFGTGATANTSGARLNISAGAHDLAVDPQYTATGSNNYGVGANAQDKGFPDATRNVGANQSATVNYSAIGAAEPQVTGGGGMLYIPDMAGT